jgi:hypothetical protein
MISQLRDQRSMTDIAVYLREKEAQADDHAIASGLRQWWSRRHLSCRSKGWTVKLLEASMAGNEHAFDFDFDADIVGALDQHR